MRWRMGNSRSEEALRTGPGRDEEESREEMGVFPGLDRACLCASSGPLELGGAVGLEQRVVGGLSKERME